MSQTFERAEKVLGSNCALFSEHELMLIELLSAHNNAHLFENWDACGENDDAKIKFVGTLMHADASYPGGLASYIENAQKLLAQSKAGSNPFEGFVPEQPDIFDVTALDKEYLSYEATTLEHLDTIGFVMVAGGLGERLGYNGIKIDIPFEGITGQTYLQYYCESIKALEQKATTQTVIPFIIMTSQDTHEKTMASLEQHNYYGLSPEQVHVLKQELVPAIASNDGALALDAQYQLALKPHGHGDIHMLNHTSGIAQKMYDAGKKYLMFIQDTNGQAMNAALALFGISIDHQLDFNSAAVNRMPGEAAGALTKLVRDTESLTLNVEYNQLDALLRETINPEGDVANESGFSIFPGNINTLVIRLQSYVTVLKKSKGIIAEFVNPKYADGAKEVFTKPTRLETMMQDYPKLLDTSHKVGVSLFNREWCFSAIKNNVIDAQKKFLSGGVPECASTAERDYYLGCQKRLELAGMQVETGTESLFLGLPYKGPQVVMKASFGIGISEVMEKVVGGFLSGNATLVLEGKNIRLENVSVTAGSGLIVRVEDDVRLIIKDLTVTNEGFTQAPLTETELAADEMPEHVKIRGYQFVDTGALTYEITEPGDYTIGSDGALIKH